MNSAEEKVLRAVAKIYKSKPPVRKFTIQQVQVGKNKFKFVAQGYVWYIEPLFDEILNSYADLIRIRKERKRRRLKKLPTKKK